MKPEEYIQLVEAALLPLADADRARQMKAYLRDQFDFLGVPSPIRKQAVKPLPKPLKDPTLILSIARKLWEKEEREYRYMAIDLLSRYVRLLKVEHLTQLKEFLQQDPWWETVDGLANVIGDIILLERDRGIDSQVMMDEWLSDADFWVRRVAMIHQLGWRLKTDSDRLLRYAETLSSEREFFICKAIGWAFRDYARWNPTLVSQFMTEKRQIFSPLTIREAIKHL